MKRAVILNDYQRVALSSADWSVLEGRAVAMRERTPFPRSTLERLAERAVGTDLYGSTLGLCGLGRIGAMVARVGTAFGMNLIAWSQNLTEIVEDIDAFLTGAPIRLIDPRSTLERPPTEVKR